MRKLLRVLPIVVLSIAVLALSLAGSPARAAFPGTNGRIIFAMQDPGGGRHIWSMNPDGADRTKLTTSASHDDYGPAASADGTKAVYVGSAGQTETLRVRDLHGPSDDGISGTTGDFLPDWLPDGSGLIFIKDVANKGDIFRMDLSTHTSTNITNTPNDIEDWAVVSPDGAKIAFADAAPGSDNADLWVMDIDGNNRMQLTNTPDVDEGAPDWSPDGSQIVFDRWGGADNAYDIYKIDADGQHDTPVVVGTINDYEPVFSPDGTMITWERQLIPAANVAQPQGGPGWKYHIMVADADGGNITDISPLNATSDFSPNWAVDVPGLPPLTWADNNCSGAYDPLDALYALNGQAELAAAPSGCPALGQTLRTASWGDLAWGDLNCSGGFDLPDVLLLLRDAARLEPANLQDCPALGVQVALLPG